MKSMIARLSQSSIFHCAGALLMMASWAYFANSAHPFPKPVYAAIVQGSLSALITLVLKTFIERLSQALSGITSLIIPPFAASLTSFTLLSTVHYMASTPEIWLTIAIPFSIATLYAISYNFALWKLRSQST